MQKQWKIEKSQPRGIYPYSVFTQDFVNRCEYKELAAFCRNTIGEGGHVPSLDSKWFCNITRDRFSFKEENDMLIFFVAYCG